MKVDIQSEVQVLIELTKMQIFDNFKDIKYIIFESLHHTLNTKDTEKNELGLRSAIANGNLQVWFVCDEGSGIEQQCLGIMSTMIVTDTIANVKNLLIYSLTSSQTSIDLWSYLAVDLTVYAKKFECMNVMCFTTNEAMIKLAERYNGKVEYFLSFNMEV